MTFALISEGSPAAVAIGVILENRERSPDHPVFRGLELRVEASNAAGGVHGRQVEMVLEPADGAHPGLPENCVDAWKRLAANRTVAGIIGPGISDNCIPLVEVIDAGRVPTINWSGSQEARGEWYFRFQWGSLQDEADYLVALLERLGHRRVAILSAGAVGAQYYGCFEEAAPDAGIEVVAHRSANVHEHDVTPHIAGLRASSPDAVVFLGMGAPTLAFGRAIRDLDWEIPRFANIAMLSAALDEGTARLNDGIVWTDQYEPENERLQHVQRCYRERFGEEPPPTGHLATGYDMMTLMLAGLQRAPHLTRAGLKMGLERVRNLPSATGGQRPVMGFGPWERTAIKGADLFMYRTVRDGAATTYQPPR